jgi:MFS family permease
VGFESLAVSTAIPAINAEFAGGGAYGWVLSAYMLGNMLGTVLAGHGADRRGLLAPFVAALAMFGAALGLAALAPTLVVLIVARLLQGVGGGGIQTVAYTTIGRAYEPERRSRVFALLSSAWVVPGAIGPVVAALVTERFGFRAVFAGILPLVFLALALTAPPLARLGAPEQGGEAGASAAPVAPPALSRRLRSAIALRGAQAFAFFGLDSFVPPLVHDVLGHSHRMTGLTLTATTLCWTLAAWIADRALTRRGPRVLLVWSFLLVLAGGVMLLASPLAGIGLAIAGASVAGFGVGLGYGPLSVVMLAQATEGHEGKASSAMTLTEVLAVAVASGLGGTLIDAFRTSPLAEVRGVSLAFTMAIVAAVVGLAASARIDVLRAPG